jgi:hypothetical protein
VTVVCAHSTMCPSIHIVGSACSSIRGKQKYSSGGKRSYTPNLDRRSCPSRGVGVCGRIKKEWQKWKSPQEQAKSWVKQHSRGWPDMPRTVIFLQDLGTREKGIAEMLVNFVVFDSK